MYYIKLWQKFINGDKKALSLIFRTFYEEMYNYAYKLTNSNDIAEDSIQDLFLKLWKTKTNLNEVQNIKAYLFISLRNITYDNLKWYKKQNISLSEAEDVFEIQFSSEDILIRNQVDKEIRNKLLNALNQLSSKQKEAIYLRYFESLDFETISKIMEINVQSVRNFIHRGISALRDIDFFIK